VSRFILILALFTVGYLIYRLYLKKMRKPTREESIKIALVAGGLFFIIMAVTGRASMIFAAIGAAMTAALRFYPLLIRLWPRIRHLLDGSAGAGQTSRVTTRVLVMTLDHVSGRLDGEITDGTHRGKHLSELSLPELQAFYRYCQARDPQAEQVLQAYIQRERLDEWQDAPNSQSTGDATTTLEEAWNILGLEPGADRKAIIEAHRRLMSRFHPDKGGSNYLASKINAAKQILLDNLD